MIIKTEKQNEIYIATIYDDCRVEQLVVSGRSEREAMVNAIAQYEWRREEK